MAEAQPVDAPREPPPHAALDVIDTREAYHAAIDALTAGTGPYAVDAERASGFRYSQRAYLIQIFRRDAGVFLFDPPAIGSMSELGDRMAGTEWVLHAASQDLACLREVGLDPVRLFDTELGARLAGLTRVGLGAVVEDLLGIHLAKEHSAADWSTRPLPQGWLLYAALDVELLPDLRDRISAILDQDGKTRIAEQEFDAVLHRETVARADPWRRLSGIHSLRSPKQLAVARELWRARDDYAREVDTAPGRLVPDASLVVAAKELPTTKRELADLKDFTGRASRTQLDRWLAAISAGLATDDPPPLRVSSDTLPPPRTWSDKNPDADGRLKRARAAVSAVAEQLAVPVENVLTPEYLRRVAWSPPEPVTPDAIAGALARLGARPWQVDAVSAVVAAAFVEAAQSPPTTGDATS